MSDWSSSGSYGHSAQPSVSYSSSSSHQHATATASSSSSQPAPNAKLPSKERAPAVSGSHSRLSEDEAKMRGMMGRVRLPIGSMPTEAPSAPSASTAGDKRKDRTSPPLASIAKASPAKRKKEALRVKDHKKNRTEATAELAKRLPGHLQVFEAPSVKHIRQAIVHIDEQKAHIERLEDDGVQSRAAQAQLASENCVLRKENETLRGENLLLRQIVDEKDTRIRYLERGRTW